MEQCGGCARPMPASAARCMYCGTSKAPPKQCPKCRRSLDAFAQRCVFCNIDLGAVGSKGPDPRAIALARSEIYQQAERLRRAGQTSAAHGLLDQVLIADPRFVPAWVARGKCFAAELDWLGARDSARCALAIDPTHAEAATLFETWAKAAGAAAPVAEERAKATHHEAHRLLDAGRAREALERFDVLVSSIMPERRDAPELATLHNARGVALQRVGRLQEAIASFDEALRVDPNHAAAWQNRASALDDMGRVREALTNVERAIALDTKKANPWVDLGFYRQKLGLLGPAIAAYEQALALDPQHVLASFNLGNVLAETGDRAGAERAYRAALATSPDFGPARDALAKLRGPPR